MKTTTVVYLVALVTAVLGERTQADTYETILNNLVWIPPGTFTMGSPDSETNRDSDEMKHQVTVSRGFYISKYETTRREYFVVMNYPYYITKDLERPIEGVAWSYALNYCARLTEKERKAGRLPQGYIFRLPTEAEWEYACRADTTTATAYGNSLNSGQANFNGDYPYNTSVKGLYLGQSELVGSYKPNGWGLYDMHGNASEWCLDWYGEYPKEVVIDPSGPTSGLNRVVRGGRWDSAGYLCRSARRGAYNPRLPGNNIGFRVVLALDFSTWASEVFGNLPTPTQPTYGVCPTKEEDKGSLVVVTHGWQPTFLPVDIAWVGTMTNAISKYLANQGKNNWQVHAYRWVEGAYTILPGSALDRGEKEGVNLGNCLKEQGWKHIHFICHSAGALLIETASLLIKENDIRTTIHTTFLDPYVGLNYGGRSKYGLASDWSDGYSTEDAETFDIITGLTGGSLNFAYNVNVTSLDPNKVSRGTYRSSWNGEVEECYQTVTSHEWAHQFYFKTIGQSWPEAKGLGFPLSEEGGNWDFALSQYKVGNNPPLTLGNPDPSCIPDLTLPLPDWNPFVDLLKLLIIKSALGTSQVSANGVTLTTDSPIWFTALVPITNSVNLVSFDSQFLSHGAEGLLSVYRNTNILGSIDERVVVQGLRHYTFGLQTTQTNGTYSLGFRLDAFSAIQSSVIVTNVALGFVGVRESFSLSFTSSFTNGLPVLQLNGPSGFTYIVEASTNLVDWETAAVLINTNGTVRFIDSNSIGSASRFYRAVAP